MALRSLQTRDIPNFITSLRILLVPPFLWLLLQEQYGIALLLFVIAGISDVLDGFLAKSFGWTSKLGGILDPLADKLLLMGSMLVLGWLNELPLWLVVLVIVRDVLIMTGAISYHFLVEQVQASPLLISKINTLMQLVLVFTVIVNYGMMSLPNGLLTALIGLTAITTAWSGTAYVWQWGQRAWHKLGHPSKPGT